MASLIVAAMATVLGHAAEFEQAVDDAAVQNLGAESPVEALDVSTMGALVRLDMQQLDAVRLIHLGDEVMKVCKVE